MVTKKYEKKFLEIYKEAKKLGGIEAEKMSDKNWSQRCDNLCAKAKKSQDEVDEDIEKLSNARFLFRRLEPGRTKCDMIAYYIKEDCKSEPHKCPLEIKKEVVKELKEDLDVLKRMPPEPKRIERIKQQIEKLEK